jgi:AcrR family transcriptional regulator
MNPVARKGEKPPSWSAVLDATERLMIDDGYAAVTYRNVASTAGVSTGVVQYHFPTLDDLFIALLRRRADSNYERLSHDLSTRSDVLRVVWEYSRDETTSALMTEFIALANHRKSVGAEVARVTERSRIAEIDAVTAAWHDGCRLDVLEPGPLLFLLNAIPRIVKMEESFGMTLIHDDVLAFVEQYLDRTYAD